MSSEPSPSTHIIPILNILGDKVALGPQHHDMLPLYVKWVNDFEVTRTLDLGLGLAELWLRDVLCIREGVPELVYAVDRSARLQEDARAEGGLSLHAAIERVQDTRMRLPLHVSEELALEGLAYRLQELLEREQA